MHDLLVQLPLPSEILNHVILPYVPFVGLTSETLKLQRQRMKLWSRIKDCLNINDSSVKKDILENYQDFHTLEYVYNQSELFLYMSFSTLELDYIDDYFAIMF